MKGTSWISETARIGRNVTIGRFCVIEDNVVIEDGAVIHDYASIQAGSRVGQRTKVGTYCKVGRLVEIGDDCTFTAYCEIRDECRLGRGVSMGSRCTLSAKTVVEDGVIMKYAFVVTDTPVLSKNNDKVVGKLCRNSKFGANVTIMPGITVGENSEVGACSQVRCNIPDNQVWYGSPAKYYRDV
jgi:acetyltransferase-like isoleucine patch superfamily enzyme